MEIEKELEGLRTITIHNFWEKVGEATKTLFKIPSEGFARLLIRAKKYLPLIVINMDKETNLPTINIPQTEKELKEAIAKEKAKEISKEVNKVVPQFPCGAQGTGALTGLIADYAVQVESEEQ